MTMENDKKDEIQYIYELLQSCLEEEGYVIPVAKYADGNYKAFDIPLRNGGKLLVQVSW